MVANQRLKLSGAPCSGQGETVPQRRRAGNVEFEVTDDLLALAIDAGGEIRFEPGFGLDELRQAWPNMVKRLL